MIVGSGRRLAAGFPLDLRNLATPNSEAWVAFVNFKFGAHTASPYFLRHGRLHPIGDAITIDSNLERVSQDSGVLLSNVAWRMDRAWTRNGLPDTTYSGNLPLGIVYGSWSGDDREEGQIASSNFPAPTTGCLLLPISHGPFVHGIAVAIVNADTDRPVLSIPLQNGDLGWQFWKVHLDKSAVHVRITAEDHGSRWGEWLAIAQPSACDSVNH
jgi:hypothetical protein